jgi:hypothetical protein
MVLFKKEHAKHPHARHLNGYIRSNRWGKNKDITITYKKENGDISERKIRPLYAKKDVLVAHDHDKNGYRSFKLERIQSMTKSAHEVQQKTAFELGFEKRAELSNTQKALAVGAGVAGVAGLAIGGRKLFKTFIQTHHDAAPIRDLFRQQSRTNKGADLMYDAVKGPSHRVTNLAEAQQLSGEWSKHSMRGKVNKGPFHHQGKWHTMDEWDFGHRDVANRRSPGSRFTTWDKKPSEAAISKANAQRAHHEKRVKSITDDEWNSTEWQGPGMRF